LIVKTRLLIVKTRLLIVKTRLLIVKTRLSIVKTRLLIVKTRPLIIKTRHLIGMIWMSAIRIFNQVLMFHFNIHYQVSKLILYSEFNYHHQPHPK
jgi:hypothetical protein